MRSETVPSVLAGAYARALHHYCTTGREMALAEAHEVGRAAATRSTGLLWLVELHQAELPSLVEDVSDHDERTRRLQRAADFLVEALAPFEIVNLADRGTAAALDTLSVVDHADDAVVVRDPDGTVTYWNRGAERLYGWRRSDAIGQDLHELVGTRFPTSRRELQGLLDRDGGWTGRLVQHTRSGTEVVVEARWTLRRQPDGTPGSVLEMASDVTDRIPVEESLRASLERERQAVARLRETDDLKNLFLQALSHELRAPLTSVLGFARTLKRDELELDETRRSMLIERLNSQAAKLNRLLGNLLDVDRLTRGTIRLHRTTTHLDDLVHRVIQELDPPDTQVNADLERCTVEVDASKVERIVENLVANALRHTPAGTPVRIRSEAADDGCTLVVEDRGPGIPDELKTAIFEPFRQGTDDAAACPPGTGIGLTLVARFAELHGGCAWVEDRPGGGARFCVHLPAPDSAAGSG